MDKLRELLNVHYIRVFMGLIIGCTIGSPFVNNFTDDIGWLIAGIIFFLVSIGSSIAGFTLLKKHNPILWVMVVAFIADVVVIALRWG